MNLVRHLSIKNMDYLKAKNKSKTLTVAPLYSGFPSIVFMFWILFKYNTKVLKQERKVQNN